MSPYQTELDSIRVGEVLRMRGVVRRVVGLVAEAEGLSLPVGSGCQIRCRSFGNREIEAEVLGFRDGRTLLVPFGSTSGIAPGDPVSFEGDRFSVAVSWGLLGRVLDGCGRPIDQGPAIQPDARIPIDGDAVAPLSRQRISTPLSTGVRALDAALSIGRGQRVGIFSGSGVGKSVLMGMLARSSDAPVTVVALIGERGREVREFIERDLGPGGLERSIVVVATADEPAVMRLRAARVATAIAEWFRDQAQDVVLVMDSVTRVALAQRELGLSASEPPTTKAFPPSVFSLLPRLLERTGPGETGSITGFYSVLVEGDDMNDPIADTVRGILDGHVILSRRLANRGHFPAIDILGSVSRVMKDIVDETHLEHAKSLVADLARYREVEDLIQLGAYVRGSDPATDAAVERLPRIDKLLRQAPLDLSSFESTVAELAQLYKAPKKKNETRQTHPTGLPLVSAPEVSTEPQQPASEAGGDE